MMVGMKLAEEDYVRPVTGASEPKSERAATWRFRLVALVVLLVLAFLVTYVVRSLSGESDGNPITDNPQALAALLRT